MPHIIWYYWSTPKIHDSFTVTSNKKTGLNYFSYSMNHTFLRLGLGSVYYCLVFAVKQKKPYQNATWCLFPIGVLFHQSLWNFFGVKHVCCVIISTKWNYQPFWFWCFFFGLSDFSSTWELLDLGGSGERRPVRTKWTTDRSCWWNISSR